LRRKRGYLRYVTGGRLQLYYTYTFQFCQVLFKINTKTLKGLDKLVNDVYNNTMSYLPEKKRNLTEKQEAFLNHLVDTGGDFKKSAELAGYSGNHYQILKALKNEVVDLASDVLAREAPTAAFKLIEVMKSDKPVPQANNKLQAAQTILDRAGVVKTDKVDINHNVSGGIFILPEKHTIDIEAEDANYEVVNND
jgi:hypothetical protein